jgi:hypothetical protein
MPRKMPDKEWKDRISQGQLKRYALTRVEERLGRALLVAVGEGDPEAIALVSRLSAAREEQEAS